MSVPRSSASPLEAGRMPARIFSSVDLPQPEGPTTATNSPSPTPKVVRSRAATAPSRVAYVFERLRMVIASVATAIGAWSVHPRARPGAPGVELRPMTSGRVRGGFNQYGFTVGILVLDTRFPRVVGDIGNARTFPFPVSYRRVSGADPDLVVRRGAAGLLPAFVEGAQALEREGVGAITTSCGFLVKYQQELARSVRVPVFTSSLLLVPLVHRMLAPGGRVGIITVNAGTLTPEHLAAAGIGADVPLAVVGLETEKEFTHVLLDDQPELDIDLAREEHVRVARRLVAEHPDVGAIVLECTNMPPYTADIQRETGRPVFDIVSLVTMVHDALVAGQPPRRA
jgi:hypothetical protein